MEKISKEQWTLSLSDVIETIPDGLMALDADCRIRLWNAPMEKLTGYPAEEVIGENCSLLGWTDCSCGGESIPDECRLIQKGQGTGIIRKECSVRARNGELLPVLKSARVLRDESGVVTGLVQTVTDLRYRKRLEEQAVSPARPDGELPGLERLVGGSYSMNEVYDRIRLAAQSDSTVLIHGDTGTGKELVADAIHHLSARKHNPFIKVNCSALSESLLESELFGHVKGAFTGAAADKIGRFEAAEGGTLLLDEIGDISPLIQLKLLRVIQERTYERVGESRPRTANVRVIAATHRNLREAVAEGRIREDFYYRIKVFDIRAPSLLERKEDIPVLAAAFIDRLNRYTGKSIDGFSTEVNYVFMDYCWPGNVRELENAIEHAFVTCQGSTIGMRDLPIELQTAQIRLSECRRQGIAPALAFTSSAYRSGSKEELLDVLKACDWNKTEAARRLGVERTTIWRRMKKWDIPLTGTFHQ